MRSNNTFGIHFIARMNKVKNGTAAVYTRIVVDKSRCEISLKKKVEVRDWNQARALAKPKTTDLKLLNNYLEEEKYSLAESCIIAWKWQNVFAGRNHKTIKR